MKDNFSGHASFYARFRPVYPQKLYDHLLSKIADRSCAWDCGCGNGQVAGILAESFQKVIATDISFNQLSHATQKANIEYRIQPAEKTDIENASVNLITVAQALHWFNIEEFYQEVKRVSTKDGLIALWCYNLLTVSPEVDEIISNLYSRILGEFWDPERVLIEEHYQNIPFPFYDTESPEFRIEVDWTVEQLIGYLNSWSAVQHHIRKRGNNPMDQVSAELEAVWGDKRYRRIFFPIYTRIGRVHG